MYTNSITFADNPISMKTATLTDFRQRMKEHLDKIQQDQDILVLTGPKKKDFVVMTLEEYNSMEETAHLFSTTANAVRLLESIEQAKAGKTFEVELGPDGTYRKKVSKTKKKNGSK